MQDGREDEPVARMEGVSESADAKLIAISSRFRSVGRVMRRSSPQGLRGSPCGDACCAVDRQRSPEDAIRSKVFLGLDVEQFGKARASAVHPALDGADLRPANLGPSAPTKSRTSRCSRGSCASAVLKSSKSSRAGCSGGVESKLAIAPSGSSTSRLRLRNEV